MYPEGCINVFKSTGIKMKIDKVGLKCLQRYGINIPKRAVSYEHYSICKDGKNIDVFTLSDKSKLPIKRIKTTTDILTDEKEVQARFYHYLGEQGSNRKLKEINQYTFNSNNQCIDSADWRFYHAKDGRVSYSMKSAKEKRNNFPQAESSITDKNGFVLRPISIAEYLDIKRDMGRKHFVGSPWTYKESITASDCATDSAQECTVVGIVGEKGISLNHFNPNHPENLKPYAIGNTLANQLELQGENAKAFLIGGCDYDYGSHIQFDMLDDFFAVRNIRHSKYKTGDKVLYNDMEQRSENGYKSLKRMKDGEVTPLYYQSGQHIAYKDGEIKITNLIIDEELNKGNDKPKELIKKSFMRNSINQLI